MSTAEREQALVRAHLKFGWWSLLVFVSMGVTLEALHGFKASFYLHPAHETRRLMWTLAHSHGTLLAVLQFLFAATVRWGFSPPGRKRQVASACLRLAAVLLPAGFFLGGLVLYDGDPGLGVLLVPLGGLALVVGILCSALNLQRGEPPSG